MKPEILMMGPMMPHVEAALDDAYTVHRMHEAADRDALVAEIGPRIRGIATDGHLGASADLMDRAFDIVTNQRAIGAHFGFVTVVHGIEVLAWAQHTALNKLAKRHTRLRAFRLCNRQRRLFERDDILNAVHGEIRIDLLALDPDKVAPHAFGRRARGP